ncbi:transglutaminaseTgpA domain-containing protein [Streptomyces sp. enrichment culture]|uniref:transglutaminase family protein n=1 Tax=Streptomyces sp. enrichment culture TaxID=1795815 RepID=UPI003F564394
MSGRARLALCAWAATLMAACALLPLVDPATWILQAAVLLAVQSGVGAVARRVPLARPLTIAAQALVTLLLLTLVFAREQAIAGLVPGPRALQHFADLLQQGGDDIARYAIPAPLESDGIRLMLVGGVLVIGLLVDTLAVSFRSAAPAGLPLLALYSVAAGLSEGGADWLWFLVAAAGYLMLLLAEGRDRLSQWGRVFGGSPRSPGADQGRALAPVRAGRRIGAFALGIALVVPLALPAMDGGLLDGARGGVGSGTGGGGTISAVNPLVSLRDSLNVNEDREVLTLRTDSESLSDLYLRIVSLDDFDGTTWKPSKRHITAVPDGTFPTPAGLGPDIRRTEIRTLISAADDFAQDWLPMPYPPSGVRVAGNWRYEPVGMTLVGDHGQNTRGLTYEVRSLSLQPTAQQLAAAPQASAALRREYTELPDSLPEVVARTAREVTAGAANPYEQAVKLQEYFAVNGGFEYDTQVDIGSGSEAIARFLKEKEGFCVHFSFAMAAMARSLGIPARVAVGFAPGSPQANGSVSVGLRDAHAWPEVYFEGVGWTRFEPTPTRGSTPAYTITDRPGSTVPDPALPSRDARTEPSAAPSESDTCSPQDKKLDACATESAAAAPVTGGDGPKWYALLGWALAGLVVLLIPLAPMLWRLRVRAVRLGAHGRGEADAGPHTLAVWQELMDTAWDLGILPEESQTTRKAAARVVRLGRLDAAAAAAVHRVADAVEQVLYAPRPRLTAGLTEDVRLATAGLRATAGRAKRWRARLAPRSAVRVAWALSARWTALKRRAATARPVWRRTSDQRG